MADNVKAVQAQTFQLAGAGVSIGDTSVILESFTQIDGTLLTMTNFGTKGFGTFEPASGVNEEQIIFTGVTQNVDGTATLTGISTVSNVDPYTETSGFAQDHAGGVAFVISNTAGWYGQIPFKANDETITGTWLVPDPTVAPQIANKEYVDNVAITGAPAATAILPGISMVANPTDIATNNDTRTYLGNPYSLFVLPSQLGTAVGNLQFDYQQFTSSGTWTKPASLTGNEMVVVQIWGAGGGGIGSFTSSFQGGGGGGGAFNTSTFKASQLGSTETVTIGTGGVGAIGNNGATPAPSGGNTTFGSHLSAFGGGGGGDAVTPNNGGGGGGGGISSAGNGGSSGGGANGGGPVAGTTSSPESTFGGGFGSNPVGPVNAG